MLTLIIDACRGWNGRISLVELRRSTLLQVMAELDDITDINMVRMCAWTYAYVLCIEIRFL